MSFAEAGFEVTGIDLNESRVRDVQERRSYLVDVPSERYEPLEDRLQATSDFAAVGELDALTICVPTPLSKTRTPDVLHRRGGRVRRGQPSARPAGRSTVDHPSWGRPRRS